MLDAAANEVRMGRGDAEVKIMKFFYKLSFIANVSAHSRVRMALLFIRTWSVSNFISLNDVRSAGRM